MSISSHRKFLRVIESKIILATWAETRVGQKAEAGRDL